MSNSKYRVKHLWKIKTQNSFILIWNIRPFFYRLFSVFSGETFKKKTQIHLIFTTSTGAINNSVLNKSTQEHIYRKEECLFLTHSWPMTQYTHTHTHTHHALTLVSSTAHTTHEKHVSRHAHAIFITRTHHLQLCLQVQWAVISI